MSQPTFMRRAKRKVGHVLDQFVEKLNDWGMMDYLQYPLCMSYSHLKLRFSGGRSRNGASEGPVRSVLVITPQRPGSLGDEAMVKALLARLVAAGVTKIGVVTYSAPKEWEHLNVFTDFVPMTEFLEAAVTLASLKTSWRQVANFLREVRGFDRFCVMGADVLDGYYSERQSQKRLSLADLATKAGTPATILGFSFNESPVPSVVKTFENLDDRVKILCRDPISRDRLASRITHPVNLVADLAFLLKPAEDSEFVNAVRTWAASQKEQGRIVVGVNLSLQVLEQGERLGGDVKKSFMDALVTSARELGNVSFLLLPHDVRGEVSDVTLAQMIASRLAEESIPHYLFPSDTFGADEIKGVCAYVDLVFSARMHLAIACLGQGAPVACTAYQGKFEGLFQHFGLENMTVDVEAVLQPGRLTEFLTQKIKDRDRLREHVQSKLASVQALSESNLTAILEPTHASTHP